MDNTKLDRIPNQVKSNEKYTPSLAYTLYCISSFEGSSYKKYTRAKSCTSILLVIHQLLHQSTDIIFYYFLELQSTFTLSEKRFLANFPFL